MQERFLGFWARLAMESPCQVKKELIPIIQVIEELKTGQHLLAGILPIQFVTAAHRATRIVAEAALPYLAFHTRLQQGPQV